MGVIISNLSVVFIYNDGYDRSKYAFTFQMKRYVLEI